jgi:hypothetical protein
MNIKKRIIDVHIVESNKPSETDAEANALASVLTISSITAHRYYPQSRAELAETFQRIAAHPRCLSHHRHFLPFLHFALHASRAGVFLRGSELVTWAELLTLLAPLRERLEGNLLISMSACFGFYGYRLACSLERFTYHFLVGTRKSLDWRDAVLAYHVFYHSLFFRQARLPTAVVAMNSSLLSRGYAFDYTFGSEVQRNYRERFSTDETIVAVRGKQK